MVIDLLLFAALIGALVVLGPRAIRGPECFDRCPCFACRCIRARRQLARGGEK